MDLLHLFCNLIYCDSYIFIFEFWLSLYIYSKLHNCQRPILNIEIHLLSFWYILRHLLKISFVINQNYDCNANMDRIWRKLWYNLIILLKNCHLNWLRVKHLIRLTNIFIHLLTSFILKKMKNKNNFTLFVT